MLFTIGTKGLNLKCYVFRTVWCSGLYGYSNTGLVDERGWAVLAGILRIPLAYGPGLVFHFP